MSAESQELCTVCGMAAEHKCSACKSVFYCSREHQKSHWKVHGKKCIPYKIATNEVLGRHYVAIRNINVGEVVFQEKKALVEGPPLETGPVCLGCYAVLTPKSAVPCGKCGWPLCGLCRDHGPECEFTVKYKDEKVSITDFVFPHPTYRCITTIRALHLREADPGLYEKFLNLEDHAEEQERTSLFTPRFVAQFIKRFFKIDVTEQEVAKVVGILQVNGHEVPLTEPAYIAVYDISSIVEHSCRANCSKSFTSNGGIVARAAIPIKKGDHITICYTDPLWGVENRRHHLAQTKFFQCMCERCIDPTEFETMYNAIKCWNADCNGHALPKTFIKSGNERPDYTCNACSSTKSFDAVEEMMEQIGIHLSQMKKNDMEQCRKFIQEYGKFLHENHYYITDVKLALAQLIGQENPGLPGISDDLLQEKISLCKHVSQLLKKLVPAENRVLGLVLFELHAAIAECGRRLDPGELREALLESKRILAESYELLKYEPEALPEGKIAVQAHKNLQDIETILKVMHQNISMPPM
ncbi:SET domain-containing protein SmydA-8-like [Neodiprion lecontei]|uniref:SET domain-containing protein SmydA-8-like n=1 Tax=Neodiprion lecontei TaxID=441921 RepID=A0A6J0BDX6_NEOLC|nr:SET domain-containing protein SmydA-8-like [Neodiprion lecontei]